MNRDDEPWLGERALERGGLAALAAYGAIEPGAYHHNARPAGRKEPVYPSRGKDSDDVYTKRLRTYAKEERQEAAACIDKWDRAVGGLGHHWLDAARPHNDAARQAELEANSLNFSNQMEAYGPGIAGMLLLLLAILISGTAGGPGL